MKRLVCLGDLMQDVSAVIGGPIYWGSDTMATVRTQGGGSAGNVASWAAFNNCETLVVGRVGADPFGDSILAELDRYEIKTKVARDSAHQTGMVVLLVDEKGERTMFPDPGANQFLEIDDLPELTSNDVLYISGYSFLYEVTSLATQELIRRAKELGVFIAVDPASAGYIVSRNDTRLIDQILQSADFLLANEDEALVLTGKPDAWEACEALAQRVPTAVVKRGAQGAIAMDHGQRYFVPAVDVPLVVDTTGAGDSFAGGFLARFASGGTLEESLHSGVETAATCVGRIGGRP